MTNPPDRSGDPRRRPAAPSNEELAADLVDSPHTAAIRAQVKAESSHLTERMSPRSFGLPETDPVLQSRLKAAGYDVDSPLAAPDPTREAYFQGLGEGIEQKSRGVKLPKAPKVPKPPKPPTPAQQVRATMSGVRKARSLAAKSRGRRR